MSLNDRHDRSFAQYFQATVGGKGGRLRLVSAGLFSAGLISSQGILGLEIVVGALVGSVALAYPLWRKWGRSA